MMKKKIRATYNILGRRVYRCPAEVISEENGQLRTSLAAEALAQVLRREGLIKSQPATGKKAQTHADTTDTAEPTAPLASDVESPAVEPASAPSLNAMMTIQQSKLLTGFLHRCEQQRIAEQKSAFAAAQAHAYAVAQERHRSGCGPSDLQFGYVVIGGQLCRTARSMPRNR